MKKIMVVNTDGWYGEVVEFTGNYSELFNDKKSGHEIIKVKVIGYTQIFNEKNRFGGMEKRYAIGKVSQSILACFKPYPEYLGVCAGEWIKQ